MILDAQHDPLMSNVAEVMARQQVQSILIVPLIVREEVIGTIGFDVLHAPRAFTPDEIDLARTVANLVAIRLEQARLFDAEREARLLAQRHARAPSHPMRSISPARWLTWSPSGWSRRACSTLNVRLAC